LEGIGGSLTEKQHAYLTRVKLNTNRLKRMIADLLDLSRIEAGKMILVLNDVNLPKLAKEVVDQLQIIADGKNQKLQISSKEYDLTIRADGDRLSQVLTNLLDNAIKFSPSGGTIRISIDRAHGDFVNLAVQDSGPGMPPEAIPNLFDPFFQVQSDKRPSSTGLGLGLSIVKNLVDLHEGTITVDSEMGKGTTFCITLPI
jgi:signal transduction histidine kinase